MAKKNRALPGRTVNAALHGPEGQLALAMDALPVRAGQHIRLVFEEVNAPWRQGMFIATQGALSANNTTSSALSLWADNSPAEVDIKVLETNGTITVYNIWDSGRDLGPFESQALTSGMLVEELNADSRRYRCTDIGLNPDFKKLIVRLDVLTTNAGPQTGGLD